MDPRSGCVICKPELVLHKPPDIPVYSPGVVHRADCPTLPRLSDEDQERLTRDLAEIARCHREAWARSQEIWL